MITAYATTEAIDHMGLYGSFIEREGDGSGTVVLHHGRVKRPGKVVPDFSAVELRALSPDTDGFLEAIAAGAVERFGLANALVVHRLGTIGAKDTVLLAIVSSVSRDRSFEACSWIVDEIKKEEGIALIERP